MRSSTSARATDRAFRRFGLGIGVAVVLAAAATMAWQVWIARQAEIENRQRDISNIVLMLEEHLQVVLNSAGHSLSYIAAKLKSPPAGVIAGPAVREILQAEQNDTAYSLVLFAADTDGEIVAHSDNGFLEPGNVGDLPYFKAHRENKDVGILISPVYSKIADRWFICLTRRIEQSDGSFAGVVGMGLRDDVVAALYKSFDLGTSGVMTVYHDDTYILARTPFAADLMSKPQPQFAPFVKRARLEPHFVDNPKSLFDGTGQLTAVSRLRDFPVNVSVAVSLDDALSTWRSDSAASFVAIPTFLLISLPLVGFLFRSMQRRDAVLDTLQLRDRALEATHTGIVITDPKLPDNPIIYVNPAFERITGYTEAEVVGKNCRLLKAPNQNENELNRLRRAIAEQQSCEVTLRNVRKDGREFWNDLQISPVRDPDDQVVNFVGALTDISGRLQMEEQLRASQKMEAAGQLTGGIAHDFNNLLTVILGNAELLVEKLEQSPELRGLADVTQRAALRGSELTHRLLAFARRQTLDPKPTDANQLLTSMAGLLRRALPEDIEIEFVQGAGLWLSMIDPSQLEAAVLNLAINARDAMPEGGRLTIETANVRLDDDYSAQEVDVVAGQYVLVAVSDTGHGIARENLARVFEPFYTTKAVGKGSGLGLSMVYGFIKQSRGHVKIYSEPGHGTTIKLYLPRSEVQATAQADSRAMRADLGGHETILLVEDDDLVLRYAEEQLTVLGYTVIRARNSIEALAEIRKQSDIHLLFTDVVMPGGMNGRQLADEALKIRPKLKVLFTSGYTENAIVHHGRLDQGVHLLQKPYGRADLARKLRAVLSEA